MKGGEGTTARGSERGLV